MAASWLLVMARTAAGDRMRTPSSSPPLTTISHHPPRAAQVGRAGDHPGPGPPQPQPVGVVPRPVLFEQFGRLADLGDAVLQRLLPAQRGVLHAQRLEHLLAEEVLDGLAAHLVD